jgi:hypothetical protein
MKKNVLAGLLSIVLLSSCSGRSGMSLDDAQAFADSHFTENNRTSYGVDSYVKMRGKAVVPAGDGEATVNAWKASSLDFPESYDVTDEDWTDFYTGIPLKIMNDSFILYNDSNELSAESAYGVISEVLTYQYNTLDYVRIDTNDLNGLTFSVRGKYVNLMVYNYFDFPGNYSGRINADLVYDNEGYLRTLNIESPNFIDDKYVSDSSMMKIHADYTYDEA